MKGLKELLKEIHKSKNRFNSYTAEEYGQYDIILQSVDKINRLSVAEAKRNKAKKMSADEYARRKGLGEKVKQAECETLPSEITKEELIFRVMTFDHIPEEPGRKKNPKTVADTRVKLPFPPFKHYKYNDEGEIILVGKSHWVGGMENGNFSMKHAKATDKLAMMWMKLCDRYATRGNVRGYTYNDEMRGQAILQLAQIGLQFDESKSNNPFAYYTAAVTNSFVRVINLEKRNQNIRDDILEMNDMNPSYTRQHNAEWDAAMKREQAEKAAKNT